MLSALNCHTISTVEGPMPPDGSLPVRDYLESLLPVIAPLWAEQGLTELFAFDTTEAANAPQYCALYKGEWAFICMPRHITAPLGMGAIPVEQTAYCETEASGARVFYASLLGVDNGDTWQMQITTCIPIREEGEWLQGLDAQQFLPFPVRTVLGRHSAFLGAAELAKLAVIIPYIQEHMEPFDIFIPGVYTQRQAKLAPYRLFTAKGLESCLLQVTNRKDDKGKVHDVHFCVAAGAQTELAVHIKPKRGDASGLLYMRCPGCINMAVSCPQVACMPQKFSDGLVLRGYLNMYADAIVRDFPESGADDGEGDEDDFQVYVSPMFCIEGDGQGRADVYGDVRKVTPCDLGYTRLTCYTVRCREDEDDDGEAGTLVNVYIHGDKQNGPAPQPGDFVRATGSLHFLAWENAQTAQEPAHASSYYKNSQYPWGTPEEKYEELAPYGMGHGLVARCVLEWGWYLLETPCVHFSGKCYSMAAERPDGVKVVFYVDTVVNGREPVLAFCPQIIESHRAGILERWGADTLSCQVRIRLDMDTASGCYKVGGSVTPAGIVPELSLPRQIKPYAPARNQGEDQAVELSALREFHTALSTGMWGGFAECLPDDAKLLDLSTGLQFFTKEDTMRHLSMQERSAPKGTRYVRGSVKKPGGEPNTNAVAVMTDGQVTACYFLLVTDGMAQVVGVMPQAANQLFVPQP